jgi:HEPN domain-containing protein
MSQMHNSHNQAQAPRPDDEDDLERLLVQEVSLTSPPAQPVISQNLGVAGEMEEDSLEIERPDTDIQGSLGLFAEALQDMATTGVELSLGRHFACVDYCNQAVEKAAQAVSLRRFGHRSAYDHDLRALGALVEAPTAIQDEMDTLTPFHPAAFYVDTPPEEADAVINAEQASVYVKHARNVLQWARAIVLSL